jgi:hypothetical protein
MAFLNLCVRAPIILFCLIAVSGVFSSCHLTGFAPHTPIDKPSHPPSFVLIADYENGYGPFGDPWGELTVQGGVLEIISDPTSSGRGFVQRSIIGADRQPPIEERPELLVYRLYPGVFFPFKPAPFQFSQEVWISRDLLATSIKEGNHLVVGPDIFDLTPADGGESRSAIQVVLNKDSLKRGKTYLRLFNKSSGGTIGTLLRGAPELSPEKWHRIKLFVGESRDIVLFLDGVPVSRADYPATNRLGTVGGHPGLYAGRSMRQGNPLRGWMMVDNFEIRCW